MKNKFFILSIFLSLHFEAMSDTPIPVKDVEIYRRPCQDDYTWAEQTWKYRIIKILSAKLVWVPEPDHRFPYHNQTHIKTLIVKTDCKKEDPKDTDSCGYDPKGARDQKFKIARDKDGILKIFINNLPKSGREQA
ncbi:uncharacterized protein LOC141850269 [Brevipalpus obovatus]|uniref:uncharacterized protein LOC141850269 n=1 Tax=Brevipalpus obovatus TaxID=246614 RepID=UPI003D9F3B52